jgi:hypothetical protein
LAIRLIMTRFVPAVARRYLPRTPPANWEGHTGAEAHHSVLSPTFFMLFPFDPRRETCAMIRKQKARGYEHQSRFHCIAGDFLTP